MSATPSRTPPGLRLIDRSEGQTFDPSTFAASRELRVALVNMPWASATSPSIQLGLLQAIALACGHDATSIYFNVHLAAELGAEVYRSLAELGGDRQYFVKDWLFTTAAFGPQDNASSYLTLCDSFRDRPGALATFLDQLPYWRDIRFPNLVDEWFRTTDWATLDVVGFTSVFEQNVAALALARRIKEAHPHVTTLFGGANFDDVMGEEFVKVFPWIDYAIIGEGDIAFPLFLRALADGRRPDEVPGVHSREKPKSDRAPAVTNLDDLPVPLYDDYFLTLKRVGREAVLGDARPKLPIETSRGCWWGERRHCTFCGLNGTSMRFRSKSVPRAFEEIQELSGRYKSLSLYAVDNIIDTDYLDGLCTLLAESKQDIQLFYEVKANLTREELSSLARAGITSIQPGIESLSSKVLRLMRKGTTALMNVRLLKWAHYYGITVVWNLLYGFPGESTADYEKQISIIPSLYHLPPPSGVCRIWLERFSPYFFDESLGLRSLGAHDAFRFVYPIPNIDLDKAAYFFKSEPAGLIDEGSIGLLHAQIHEWRARWQQKVRPQLRYVRGPDWIKIADSRQAEPRVVLLDGWQAVVYETCSDTLRSYSEIAAVAEACETYPSTVPHTLDNFLDQMVQERTMLQENRQFLSLALPNNRHW